MRSHLSTWQREKDDPPYKTRPEDLFWHDLKFYFDQVLKHGVRPWMWQAGLWRFGDKIAPPEYVAAYRKNVPKNVLQANWFYGSDFTNYRVRAFETLEQSGYDQLPCGGYTGGKNFGMLVEHCKKVIDPSRLYGFYHAPWKLMIEEKRAIYIDAIEQVGKAKRWFEEA